MKDFTHIDRYLTQLYRDIYPQPSDPGHTAWALEVIERWAFAWDDVKNVLDVGCGEAFLEPVFERLGMYYSGVCLGDDFQNARALGKVVYEMDYHFLQFPDQNFDLIFSRHSLEHSPMPTLALMEWHRVSRKYLCVVLPNPDYWGRAGRNHYSVMYDDQAKFLLERTGWKLLDTEITEHELRYFCKKADETYED